MENTGSDCALIPASYLDKRLVINSGRWLIFAAPVKAGQTLSKWPEIFCSTVFDKKELVKKVK
jgi:hypothetical protein